MQINSKLNFCGILVIFILLPITLLAQTYQFENGNWLIKKKFVRKTVYTQQGRFTFEKPIRIDSIIDLKNKYCIPPFGDAHTHNFDGTYKLKETISTYINEGIFYVQVLGNNGNGAKKARPVLGQSKLVDVTYANGLLTSSYGHGFLPYEPLEMGFYTAKQQILYADSIKKSRLVENISYFFLDSLIDVDKKWKTILSFNPDNIKIVVLDAKNYQKKRKLEKLGDNGLSEETAAYVVKKAHKEGLRVFAHIETAEDARLCARIGVDVLAHLPGYGWSGKLEDKEKFCMTKADAKLFKKNNLAVIPTINLDYAVEFDSLGKMTTFEDRFINNLNYEKKALKWLIKYKVPIGLAADDYGKTVTKEIDYLLKYKHLSNKNIIYLYCTQTPQLIFPNRKIGEIKEDFEASFLVVDENPFRKIETIKSLTYKVRQGVFIK